jgi:hypothetical protein
MTWRAALMRPWCESTNAFGWPQLILSVFEIDALGRDVIRGYGCIHLPICAGQFTRKVPLYKPLSASALQQAMSWVSGRPAEFSNPKFPAGPLPTSSFLLRFHRLSMRPLKLYHFIPHILV